jgi:hypothetical protein
MTIEASYDVAAVLVAKRDRDVLGGISRTLTMYQPAKCRVARYRLPSQPATARTAFSDRHAN